MTTWSLQWQGDRLLRARARLPDGGAIELRPGADEHPVLGRCDVVADAGGRALAMLSAVQWARPSSIPPLDVPGALPPGAGSCVLNLLAMQARAADITALRYHGPYPSFALFETLRGSFAVAGELDAARERFTAEVERAAFSGTAIAPAVDFVPDPHEWSWPSPRVCAQHRHGLERVWIDGRAWDRDGQGPRRLRRERDGWAAVFEIDGVVTGVVARFDDAGRAHAEPLARLPIDEDAIGVALPEELAQVLAVVLERDAIAALRPALAELLLGRALVLGDTGFELAIVEGDRIVVHPGLAERAAEIEPARSLPLFAAALRPALLRAAQQRIAATAASRPE
jgi:hypothetical protein